MAGNVDNYGSILEKSFEEVWNSKKRREMISKLPIEKCGICSPFSLRVNRFLSEICEWDLEEIENFYNKYKEYIQNI